MYQHYNIGIEIAEKNTQNKEFLLCHNYWNEYSMTNLLGMLPVKLHQLNLDLSRIIHLCSNFFYFYLIFTSRHQLDNIYLDITKAFDTFSLLYKLSMFNIGGELYSWFLAYVTNRSQFLFINGCNSDLLPVESRVPQGSILGSLLFIIYMNDIPSACSCS